MKKMWCIPLAEKIAEYGPIEGRKFKPRLVRCKKCKKRFTTLGIHCGCGFDCACYVDEFLPPHKRKIKCAA